MPKLLPDESFYPSPTMAMQAPVETLAYVALLNPDPAARDAFAVLDVDPASPGYGSLIELHEYITRCPRAQPTVIVWRQCRSLGLPTFANLALRPGGLGCASRVSRLTTLTDFCNSL